MAELSVKLPKKLKEFVERRAAAGGFSDVSSYISHIIAKDQSSRAKVAETDLELKAGEQSGFVAYDRTEIEKLLAKIAAEHRLSKKNAA